MTEREIVNSVDKVCDIVDKAVNRQDFKNLNRDIRRAMEPFQNMKTGDMRAWTQVPPKPKNNWREQNAGRPMNGGHMEGSGNAFHGTYRGPQRSYGTTRTQQRPPKIESVLFKKASTTGAKAMFGIGFVGALINGSIAAMLLLASVFSRMLFTPLAIVFGVIALAFAFMSAVGSRNTKRLERYEVYRSLLEDKKFASVAELAAAVNQSERKTKADLRLLMQEGYFTQGHFDVKETTFIVSDEMYAMYRATEENAARVRAEEARKEAEANVLPPDVRELLTKGEEYIQRIHEANDNIPDRGITDKLDRMEAIVTRIFEEVRKNPSLAGNLNMFMDYYLPTTIKLVGAYEEMDRQQMQGENIRNAKAEISDSLDTINDAFEKLLDSFFADTAMDVSTDISVMKTMMKQEGLTDDDLTAMRKKQATKAAGTARQMQPQTAAGSSGGQQMQPQGGQKRQAASGSEGQQVQLTFGTGSSKVQSDAPLREEDIYGLEDAPEGMVSMPLGGEEDF